MNPYITQREGEEMQEEVDDLLSSAADCVENALDSLNEADEVSTDLYGTYVASSAPGRKIREATDLLRRAAEVLR